MKRQAKGWEITASPGSPGHSRSAPLNFSRPWEGPGSARGCCLLSSFRPFLVPEVLFPLRCFSHSYSSNTRCRFPAGPSHPSFLSGQELFLLCQSLLTVLVQHLAESICLHVSPFDSSIHPCTHSCFIC